MDNANSYNVSTFIHFDIPTFGINSRYCIKWTHYKVI